MSNLNDKSTPNQMRVLMKRMREGTHIVDETNKPEPKKDLDMRDMLKITRSIHEGVNERVAEPIDKSQLTGEALLKANYGTLVSDLEFSKLATAYENFLKIKRINFEPSGVLQTALSSARDLIAEYLQAVRGINVTGEDVQNFFHSMLNKSNNITLNEEEAVVNKKTVYDQSMEEEKFRNFFNDLNVSIKLIELGIYNNFVFWGGTIDGVIQFVYKVTPDEATSGVEFNYLEDFSPDNPENDEIVGRVESYFDNFYRFWQDNVLSSNVEVEKEEPIPTMSYEKPDKTDAEPKTTQMNQEPEEDELQQAAE